MFLLIAKKKIQNIITTESVGICMSEVRQLNFFLLKLFAYFVLLALIKGHVTRDRSELSEKACYCLPLTSIAADSYVISTCMTLFPNA